VIKRLQDFDALLLTDGKLPDLRVRVDGQAVTLGHRRDFLRHTPHIEPETRLIQSEDDVFCNGLRLDQHKVLVYHADTVGDGIARGAESDGLAVYEDLPFIGPV